MIKAKDIMTDEIVVIYEDMLVHQVAHLMLRDRVSGFPVISKKIGLIGIITMTDFFMMINKACGGRSDEDCHKRISAFRELPVGEVMSRHVVTISPETTLDEIMTLVVKKGIHAFPVMSDKKIVGIVSRHDILNAIFSYE